MFFFSCSHSHKGFHMFKDETGHEEIFIWGSHLKSLITLITSGVFSKEKHQMQHKRLLDWSDWLWCFCSDGKERTSAINYGHYEVTYKLRLLVKRRAQSFAWLSSPQGKSTLECARGKIEPRAWWFLERLNVLVESVCKMCPLPILKRKEAINNTLLVSSLLH